MLSGCFLVMYFGLNKLKVLWFLKDGTVWRTNKFMDVSQFPMVSSSDMRIWERRLIYCVPVSFLSSKFPYVYYHAKPMNIVKPSSAFGLDVSIKQWLGLCPDSSCDVVLL